MHQGIEPPDRIELGFAGIEVAKGDHIGHYYQHADECVSVATDILAAGLGEVSDKCVCLAVPDTLERIKASLSERGIDTEAAIRSNQLVMFNGHGSPKDLRARMDWELASVPSEHRMLRWIGDMTWAFVKMATAETLMEFECLANGEKLPAVLFCQYDIRRFPGNVIVDALKSHPLSIIGDTIYENPYFVEPADFLEELHAREPSRLAMS